MSVERVACIECGHVGPWTIQPCFRCRDLAGVRRATYAMRNKRMRSAEEIGRRAAAGELGEATDDEFDL